MFTRGNFYVKKSTFETEYLKLLYQNLMPNLDFKKAHNLKEFLSINSTMK